MPGSDFEKQVEHKMDELNFIPSHVVWAKVEKQIAARKKRRRILLWFFLLFFLIGGGVAWSYINNDTTGSRQKPLISVKGMAAPADKSNNKIVLNKSTTEKQKETPAIQNELKNGNENTVEREVVKKETITGPHASKEKMIEYATIEGMVNIPGRALVKIKKQEDLATHPGDIADKKIRISANEEENQTDVSRLANKTSTQKNMVDNLIDSTEKAIVDTVKMKPEIVKIENNTDSVQAVLAVKKPGGKRKQSIEWGATVNAGASNISRAFSGFLKSSPALMDASYFSSASSNANIPKPSNVKTGAAYSIGLSFRKKWGRTFSFFAGLNYSYYSTKIDVGQKTGGARNINQGALGLLSINVFYLTANTSLVNYTNRYHFIELPFGIEKQLGSKSRFSFNPGFTIAQFIGSNALHYDVQNYIYYKDNNLINKTQFTFFAGFSYRLWQNQKTTMQIGPQLHYGLTNLYKKEFYGSRHLLDAAISARLFFNNKKK